MRMSRHFGEYKFSQWNSNESCQNRWIPVVNCSGSDIRTRSFLFTPIHFLFKRQQLRGWKGIIKTFTDAPIFLKIDKNRLIPRKKISRSMQNDAEHNWPHLQWLLIWFSPILVNHVGLRNKKKIEIQCLSWECATIEWEVIESELDRIKMSIENEWSVFDCDLIENSIHHWLRCCFSLKRKKG